MADRLPSTVQAERAIERARVMAGLAPAAAGTGDLHLHYHEAPVPAPAAGPAPAPRDDAGWALLNRLVPYMVLAGYLVIIITGCAVVLAYVISMLVALVSGLVALAIAAAVVVLAIKQPGVVIKGNRNHVGTGRTDR